MITVYFDSNFYVWLRKADEATFREVIDDLNRLEVRGVLSRPLLHELGSFVGPDDKSLLLHERVQQLRGGYLDVSFASASWEFLRFPQAARAATSAIFGEIERAGVQAEAHGAFADRLPDDASRMSTAERNAFERSMGTEAFEDVLRLQALPLEQRWEEGRAMREAMYRPLLAQMRALAPMLEEMGGSFDPNSPQGGLFAGLAALMKQLERPETPEEALETSRQIKEALGDLSDGVERSHAIRHAATRTDNRVLAVVAGEASEHEAEKLSHTFRDVSHIDVFLEHLEHIDLLQVDGARQGEIVRYTQHPVALASVAARVFTAPDLRGVVTAIRRALSA